MRLKNDRYKKVRGGTSRLLAIMCPQCGEFVLEYQKDGSGALKRLYIDRVRKNPSLEKYKNCTVEQMPDITCKCCKSIIGRPFVYKKENRVAFRPISGGFIKKIVKI